MIIWALFDSGNGCYSQSVKELNEGGDKSSNIDFKQIRGYNERSNIPISLVKSIFNQILEMEGLNER